MAILKSFVFKAGKDADDAAPKVDTLNNALDAAKNAGGAGASGLKSFGDAIRDLKNEIPGLIEGLAELDAESRIGGAYQAAISKARSVGEVMQATALRDEAVKALGGKGAREAGSKSMLDLIGYAEGTDKGRGYNETLGYGAFTGGRRNLVTMTLDEVQAMQKQMLAHPENGFNSSAVGRYQIVGKTMKGLMAELGLSGKDGSMQTCRTVWQRNCCAVAAAISVVCGMNGRVCGASIPIRSGRLMTGQAVAVLSRASMLVEICKRRSCTKDSRRH